MKFSKMIALISWCLIFTIVSIVRENISSVKVIRLILSTSSNRGRSLSNWKRREKSQSVWKRCIAVALWVRLLFTLARNAQPVSLLILIRLYIRSQSVI